MIFVFNETPDKIWEFKEKGSSYYRIGVANTNFGIDILKKDDIDLQNYFFEDAIAPSQKKDVKILSCLGFAICYNNRSGLPFCNYIIEANEKNYDLYLITYKVPEGMDIVYERNGKLTVLYTKFDKENKLIHIIAAGRPVNNPSYYLTFIDKNHTQVITKHIVYTKNSIVKSYIHDYTIEEAENSNFNKVIFGKTGKLDPEATTIYLKPSRHKVPYGVIVYPFSNKSIKDICEKRYHKNEKYTHYVNSEDPEVITKLKNLIAEKYTAATFYYDTSDKPSDVRSECVDKWIIELFQTHNYITNDGFIH